jgi:Sperm-tail PG-rich repeat
VRQKNTENKHTGMKTDTVGPGDYDINRNLGNRRGPQWHAPRQTKKSALSTLANNRSTTVLAGVGGNDPTPGPGYYLAEKAEVFPLYKYKQSSAFASKVDRTGRRMRNSLTGIGGAITHSGAIGKSSKTTSALGGGIKSFNPLSPQGAKTETRATEKDDDEDYYEEEVDDGTTPGPGQYFNNQSSTTFKPKRVPERLQFFGSTVERFNRNAKQLESVPGPGAYSYTQ